MPPRDESVWQDLIWQDPNRMSGAPCIRGTRIRVQDLFDWVAGGGSLDAFLDAYPHVPRDKAVGILRLAESDLLDRVKAA